MIIDIHTHLPYHKIFPPAFMDNIAMELVNGDLSKKQFVGKVIRANLNDFDGNGLIAHMDDAGIDKSIILIADFGCAMGEAELSIGEMHDLHYDVLKRNPDRFIIFGGVDPRRGKEGYDLFERSIKEFGFKGLKLYPPCGFEMDDPALYPLYEICKKYDLPVLSHTGPSFNSLRTERSYPESIMKITEDFPMVNFILGHGGAVAWKENVSLACEKKNVYLDISTFQTTVQDNNELEERFRHFFDHIPDQVLFGSDWPMFMMGSSLKKITDIIYQLRSINDLEREKLFKINAKSLLKI